MVVPARVEAQGHDVTVQFVLPVVDVVHHHQVAVEELYAPPSVPHHHQPVERLLHGGDSPLRQADHLVRPPLVRLHHTCALVIFVYCSLSLLAVKILADRLMEPTTNLKFFFF